jgi:hypothetical protein
MWNRLDKTIDEDGSDGLDISLDFTRHFLTGDESYEDRLLICVNNLKSNTSNDEKIK